MKYLFNFEFSVRNQIDTCRQMIDINEREREREFATMKHIFLKKKKITVLCKNHIEKPQGSCEKNGDRHILLKNFVSERERKRER